MGPLPLVFRGGGGARGEEGMGGVGKAGGRGWREETADGQVAAAVCVVAGGMVAGKIEAGSGWRVGPCPRPVASTWCGWHPVLPTPTPRERERVSE